MSDETPHNPPRFSEVVRDLKHFLVVAHRRGLLKVPRPDSWVDSIPTPAQAQAQPAAQTVAPGLQEARPTTPFSSKPAVAVEKPPRAVDHTESFRQENRQESSPRPEWVSGDQKARVLPELGAKPVAAPAADDSYPSVPDGETRSERLEAFYQAVGVCQRCGLCRGRNSIVFGSGNPDAGVMLIGEGPGRFEDLEGKPFVGPSGQLLTKMISAAGLVREKDLFITNVVKCRPPNNRDPEPNEVSACSFILKAQLEVIQPKVIVVAGLQAAKALLGPNVTLTGLRQKRQRLANADAIVTFHPSFLLRQAGKKADAWSDWIALRRLMAHLGLAAPVPDPWWT